MFKQIIYYYMHAVVVHVICEIIRIILDASVKL